MKTKPDKKLWLLLLVPLILAGLTMTCIFTVVAADTAKDQSGPTGTLAVVGLFSFIFSASLGRLAWRIFHPSTASTASNELTHNIQSPSADRRSIIDLFKVGKYKQQLESCQSENDQLKQVLAKTEAMTVAEIHLEIERLTADRLKLEAQTMADIERARVTRTQIEQEAESIQNEIRVKKSELIVLEEELLLQSFGFYKMKYAFENSEQYKARIEIIRDQQAQLIKAGRAAACARQWTVEGSAREGQRMINENIKLIVRSFNNECDASIVNVKFNNVDSIEKKIRKAYETLNKLCNRLSISLSPEYLYLKLQELYLCYEYQVKKQEEREEQKRIKEQMREEVKLMREIEEAKLRIEKEHRHFCNALQKIHEQLSQAVGEEVRSALVEKKNELEGQLAGLEKDRLNVLNREQNTRAGYVYIISNVGSFGENVYKIGVTRRLDPTERIDELGDASVPFDFDIHATIFSEDAPKLEAALHRAFEKRRLNMINNRREFFQVTLNEIETEVKKNFNKTVEFTRLADAAEYRQSIMLRQDGSLIDYQN